MTLDLDGKTVELLEQLPPMFRRDPDIQGTLNPHALEIERIEEAIDTYLAGITMSTANTYLALWEALFGLTIAPDDLSLEQRRNVIQTYFRRMKTSSSGAVWEKRVTGLVGPNWTYTVYNPYDLMGLWWDRYGDGLTGADGEVKVNNNLPIENSHVTVKFSAEATGGVGALLKWVDANNWLTATVTDSDILIRKCVAGSITDTGASAVSLTPGGTYYLVGTVIGNAVTANIYDIDPSKAPSSAPATPLESTTYTLTSGPATALGTGVAGKAGIRWDEDEWAVFDNKCAVPNVTVPDYTIRVTLPFEPDSTQEGRVKALLTKITPANIDLEVFNDVGFILGISTLGGQGL